MYLFNLPETAIPLPHPPLLTEKQCLMEVSNSEVSKMADNVQFFFHWKTLTEKLH